MQEKEKVNPVKEENLPKKNEAKPVEETFVFFPKTGKSEKISEK